MTMTLKALLLGATLTAITTPAFAHRQWMLPSATVFSGTNDWVTIDAAVSNDLFFPDHRPGNLQAIKVLAPDGTAGQIEHGATGEVRSIFDVHLTKPGTWRIGTQSSNVGGTFKLNGEERRVGGRFGGAPGAPGGAAGPGGPGGPSAGSLSGATTAGREGGSGADGGPRIPRTPPVALADIPTDATDVKLTETISRNELFITAGTPTAIKPTGKGLEFDPVTHPSELVSNEPAKFRFVIDGKPAPNLKVTLIAGGKKFRDGEQVKELTTGADGVVTVTWPMPGFYWINATATDSRPSEPRATERRMSYTTTVEVPAP